MTVSTDDPGDDEIPRAFRGEQCRTNRQPDELSFTLLSTSKI
jgi:hypothetical protein